MLLQVPRHAIRPVLATETKFDDLVTYILRKPALDLMWTTGFTHKPGDAEREMAVAPDVKRTTRYPEISTCRGDLFGYLFIVLDPAKALSGLGIREEVFVPTLGWLNAIPKVYMRWWDSIYTHRAHAGT